MTCLATTLGGHSPGGRVNKVVQFDVERALVKVPSMYSMMQWKTELEQFCKFMVEQQVRSFLEIGSGSGLLSVFLKCALDLDKVCACDLFKSPLLEAHPEILFFHGDHHGHVYPAWREQRGHIDMVFIDAEHDTGFQNDYQIECKFPHRFIAFHDIANRGYPELSSFWRDEVQGRKQTFVNQDPRIPFGVPPLQYPVGLYQSQEHYERNHGRCCGIGVCWNEEFSS